MKRDNLKQIVDQLKGYLEIEEGFGCREYLLNHKKDEELINYNPSKEKPLELLSKRVSNCRRCTLYRHRKNVVFGKGNINTQLLFIGEAPGEEEDLTGEPFVGKAGALLSKIMNSLGLERREVYITNCLKCRPPLNRPPSKEELASCEEYLIEQINIIKPKLICALGKYAAWNLLKREEPISVLRGSFYDYHNITVIPTFHPAYLLRNPRDKKLVWEDMKKIIQFLKK
ncbi:MAG: uracil-DNA glycosylase [Candidatus Omnitrophica bacterium]|nr:uracil-DNA glycosylase [Candidatus Omnitrophota bacterium]